MLTLDTSIREIGRVGATTAKFFNNLDIDTVEDLLFYFPFRYDDFSKIFKIAELKPGINASVAGRIELIQNKKSFKRKLNITEALVTAESGSVKITWFNQPFIVKNLKEGDRISIAGRVDEDYGGVYFNSPVYEKLTPQPPYQGVNMKGFPLIRGIEGVHTQGIVPHYHLTGKITQKQLRFVIRQIINLAKNLPDWLPLEIINQYKLLSLEEAIRQIHFPANQVLLDQAKKRLAFNELFLIQLQSQLSRQELASAKAVKINFFEKETKEFVDSLPFKLTDAQRKAAWEILTDLDKKQPMTRLLEGDVGSGKTVVATMAILNTALNNQQAVLMVPTEILAKQHYRSISKLLANFNFSVGLLTSSLKDIAQVTTSQLAVAKKDLSQFVAENAQIIIGTHALIQEKVKFNNLALAVIDEQHRFGVEQRKQLIEKSGGELTPHLLSMTATPIPRSLALALYGDLDLSIINQMPADRKKIITKIVPESKRLLAYDFIRNQIREGRQVFVICPLIDVSDKLGVKSVKEEFEKLDKVVFPDLNIGILHGKMKVVEKEKIMQEFLDNKIKILVSTSVVEVGVDVPNASVMMIEGADRFGLAQLHQFRGRVGRSEHQSYCFLLTDSDLPQTTKRLEALEKYHDGFALAKIDLKMRGPGEVYGQLQKGFPELKIASLFDYELMKEAKEAGEIVLKQDSSLNKWGLLKDKLGEMEKGVHLE